MSGQPSLTPDEWALVTELLERERYELPAEIHHTRTSHLRDELKLRLAMIDQLLRRLRDQAARAET